MTDKHDDPDTPIEDTPDVPTPEAEADAAFYPQPESPVAQDFGARLDKHREEVESMVLSQLDAETPDSHEERMEAALTLLAVTQAYNLRGQLLLLEQGAQGSDARVPGPTPVPSPVMARFFAFQMLSELAEKVGRINLTCVQSKDQPLWVLDIAKKDEGTPDGAGHIVFSSQNPDLLALCGACHRWWTSRQAE